MAGLRKFVGVQPPTQLGEPEALNLNVPRTSRKVSALGAGARKAEGLRV